VSIVRGRNEGSLPRDGRLCCWPRRVPPSGLQRTGRRAELFGIKMGFPRSRCRSVVSDVLCVRSYSHFVCVCVYTSTTPTQTHTHTSTKPTQQHTHTHQRFHINTTTSTHRHHAHTQPHFRKDKGGACNCSTEPSNYITTRSRMVYTCHSPPHAFD